MKRGRRLRFHKQTFRVSRFTVNLLSLGSCTPSKDSFAVQSPPMPGVISTRYRPTIRLLNVLIKASAQGEKVAVHDIRYKEYIY